MNTPAMRSVVRVLLCALATAAHTQAAPSDLAKAAPIYENEAGLDIGATLTPGVALRAARNVSLNSSLALGAEYDRRIMGTILSCTEESTFSPLLST